MEATAMLVAVIWCLLGLLVAISVDGPREDAAEEMLTILCCLLMWPLWVYMDSLPSNEE